MNLIRKIKISKLTDASFTEEEKEIIDLVNNWFFDLTIFIDEIRPDEINYMKGDLFVFQQDNKNNILYVRYNGLWDKLFMHYYLTYDEIQILIKYTIEQSFKQKVLIPLQGNTSCIWMVEKSFKQKVSTPYNASSILSRVVEEAFKKQVSK